jgi:hypothetical protein
VTANNNGEACTAHKGGEINDEEESSVDASEEEKVAGKEDGAYEERRKRPLEKSEVLHCLTPEERPNKRSKGDGGKNVDGAATNDSPP